MSLVAPQSALAQYTKVRTAESTAESTAKVEAKEANPRVNLDMTTKTLKGRAASFAQAKGVRSTLVLAGTQAAAPVLKANASSVLYGAVVYNGEWTQETQTPGIYSMPVGGTPSFTPVFLKNEMKIYSGCLAGDVYVTTVRQSVLGLFYMTTHNVYDASTWQLLYTKSGSDNTCAPDMTYDPITDAVYGTFLSEDGSGYVLGKFDIDNCTVTPVGAVPAGFNGIAAAPDGTLYGIQVRERSTQLTRPPVHLH